MRKLDGYTHFVCSKLGLLASTDKPQVVGFAHHLNQAYPCVEVFCGVTVSGLRGGERSQDVRDSYRVLSGGSMYLRGILRDVSVGDQYRPWKGNTLQNPVLRPTAKQLQSSLKVMESTTVELGASMGGRVFILYFIREYRCWLNECGSQATLAQSAGQSGTGMRPCLRFVELG